MAAAGIGLLITLLPAPKCEITGVHCYVGGVLEFKAILSLTFVQSNTFAR